MSTDSDPVFIVGMNGSGTTMLLDCLDNHPALYGFPLETKILPMFMARRAHYGDLSLDENFRKLWDDLRHIVYFRIVNGGEAPPLPPDWMKRERSFAGAVDGVFRHFAEAEGKRRWCEKSPMYALYMHELSNVFPRARFIHVIRDGRDCAASFHRRWGYTPPRTMYRWKNVVARGQVLGRTLGDRYMELRYEDLTENPEPNMKRVCAFLGEPFSEATLRIGRNRSEKKTLAASIVPNHQKWRTYFSDREVEGLDGIAGRLLAELGYETGCPKGDRTPAWLLMQYWRCCDEAMRTFDGLRLLVTVKDPKRRRLIADRIMTNIRHKQNVGFR